jgi:hypothetical protein
MKAKLGMSPIAWWNDDLPELSDDVSLEECLRQSRSAGFTGMEKGRRFPDDPGEMLPILRAADVTLCGGWFSGTLVDEELAANKDRIAPMIELFKAVNAPCIVYGEVGRSIQGDRSKPLATKPRSRRRRDEGLCAARHRVRRMVRRPGHAAVLSSSHGSRGRNRAGTRRLHAPFGRRHSAAARCRASGFCRRRRAARHRQPPCPHQSCPCQGHPQAVVDGLDRSRSPSSTQWRSAPSPCRATARSISAPSSSVSPIMAMRAGSLSRPSRIRARPRRRKWPRSATPN